MRQSIEGVIERYQNNLFAIAFNYCKDVQEAEDVVQETFIKYYTNRKEFEDETHLRAWLIRVTINKSKNTCLTFWRRNKRSLEECKESLSFESESHESLFDTVLNLPNKYKMVIHLYYYEDYSVKEIAGILNLSESNVKVRLSRGRAILKDQLKEEWEDDE